jgi:hypothetical protein
VVTISKVNDNKFVWTFKDSNLTREQTSTLSSGYAVANRLQTMLELFTADSEPALEVQIDAPGFPTVLLKAADVRNNIHIIRDTLNHVLEAWPQNAECKAREVDYDPPRIDRRWNEALYHTADDDLPPLVPASSYETPRRGTHLYFD